MRIHAIRTGQVRIRTRMQRGIAGPARRAALFNGPWTEWLPILAWAIEHEEGVIVVDTGEHSRVRDVTFAQFSVAPEEEIEHGLRAVGIDPAEVGTVVLTHLHGDHMDGLSAFPNARVLISDAEARFMVSPTARMIRRLTGQPLPPGFDPVAVAFDGPPLGGFAASHAITARGDIALVPAPGHTPGHAAVLVLEHDLHRLIAGDSAYEEAQLLDLHVDGVSPRASVARETMRTILRHAALHPTVYLPTHDPESEMRLAEGTVVSQADARRASSAR